MQYPLNGQDSLTDPKTAFATNDSIHFVAAQHLSRSRQKEEGKILSSHSLSTSCMYITQVWEVVTPNNPSISELITKTCFLWTQATGPMQVDGAPLCSLPYSGPLAAHGCFHCPLSRKKETANHLMLPPTRDTHHFGHIPLTKARCVSWTTQRGTGLCTHPVPKRTLKLVMSQSHAECLMSLSYLILARSRYYYCIPILQIGKLRHKEDLSQRRRNSASRL